MKEAWKKQLEKAATKGIVHKLTQKSIRLSWYGPSWNFLYLSPWRIKHITNAIARRQKRRTKRRAAHDARDNRVSTARSEAYNNAAFVLDEVL